MESLFRDLEKIEMGMDISEASSIDEEEREVKGLGAVWTYIVEKVGGIGWGKYGLGYKPE